MIRLIRAVTVLVIFIAGTVHSRAQAQSVAPRSQAVLKEAEQLNKPAMELYQESRYNDAISLAEHSLRLREKALGLGWG